MVLYNNPYKNANLAKESLQFYPDKVFDKIKENKLC